MLEDLFGNDFAPINSFFVDLVSLRYFFKLIANAPSATVGFLFFKY